MDKTVFSSAGTTPARLLAMAVVAVLTIAVPVRAPAATIVWSGGGFSERWSDPGNWGPRLPTTGDDVVFTGAPSFATNTLDSALSLGSLGFGTTAQLFNVHVGGSGNSALTFTGLGIQNLTGSGGPIRQQVFADAGTTGGTITFANAAGINLGTAQNFRPVDVTAAGAAVAGERGGRIVFQDTSTTISSTFTALRARGATVAGAGGGEILFRDQAATGGSTGIVVDGGVSLGAVGGRATFQDHAHAEGTLILLAGQGGGLGGRMAFGGNATTGFLGSIEQFGATSATVGSEAIATFGDASRLALTVGNRAGTDASLRGGRLELSGTASFDTTGIPTGLGTQQITNYGGYVAGALGGSTVFRDDSFIRGSQNAIHNAVDGEASAPGSTGGTTEFRDRSRAGQVEITNDGATLGTFGTRGGQTLFRDAASAERATIVSNGGRNDVFASGGLVRFQDDATAANATLQNLGGETAGALGGAARFFGRATAANASIVNGGGLDFGAGGGLTTFDGSGTTAANATIVNGAGQAIGGTSGLTLFSNGASAGNAFITNDATIFASGYDGGRTSFTDASTAGTARIDNRGGAAPGTGDSGTVTFVDASTAADAQIVNFGGRGANAFGAVTGFRGTATAGNATIVSGGGGAAGATGGNVLFGDTSTAGSATLTLLAANANNAFGGAAEFLASSNAGTARITVEGSGIAGAGGAGGLLLLTDHATAAGAQIAVNAGSVAGARGGTVTSAGLADAGTARFTVDGAGFGSSGVANGGSVFFGSGTSAAGASFTIGGGRVAGAQGGEVDFQAIGASPGVAAPTAGQATFRVGAGAATSALGGTLRFDGFNTTAGAARIVNQAGAFAASGGQTIFGGLANGAQGGTATIVNEGGDGSFGRTSFMDRTTAFSATIVNEGGTSAGNGGWTTFRGFSSAGRATIANNAGSAFGDGHTTFADTSVASNALITVQGSTAATVGTGRAAYVVFTDASSAEAVTLIAQGATAAGPGSAGGLIQFDHDARGGMARVVLEASRVGGGNGLLDVSLINSTSITFGSIEGGGTVFLGGKRMYVGANAQETTFSGLVRDNGLGGGVGGQMWVYGQGSLTLSGANTYTGGTIIGSSVGGPNGKLIVSNTTGSATGSGFVSVEQSGTLAGSGFIAGPVTLHAGGTIAPGDPVTLTFGDSLTWDGGGTIRLVLGADDAGSDHVDMQTLIRGSDGVFLFDLIDAGIVAGTSYQLLHFANFVGFDASDFTAHGVTGLFSFENGALAFLATADVAAVPEPTTMTLLFAGFALVLAMTRRRRRRA